ncbi:MAG: hypothetical protein CMC76_09375 [Flavobacteriaceae bacterium]|nr:hypothetical protein [Flavobacteriaceae bacterium]
MRCPKTNIALVIISFFALKSVVAQSYSTNKEVDSVYFLNQPKIESLVRNDSLYEATTLLNETITYSKKNNLNAQLADSYFALGKILTKMSNYKNAETYYLKALHIYDSLGSNKGKDIAFSGLVSTYLLDKNYTRFDSIYPIAQRQSKSINSELYFKNLDSEVKRYYYAYENQKLYETSKFALEQLDSTDFSKITISGTYEDISSLKNRFRLSYAYHNAIAKIKLPNNKTYGYKELFAIDENDLKVAFDNEDHDDAYRKLGTFNYYKYLYYNQINKNLDSANKYLLKSDTYKYRALIDFENRNAKNGELIYKIINTEQQLNLANELQKQDAKTSKILIWITTLIGIVLLGTLVVFFFYFKARKNVTKINRELKESNKKLIDIDKNRLEFFSILSHELRTPIYGITGLATLVNQEKDEEKRQSYLDSLISSSSYLSVLIDNILQANKLKFDKKELRQKPNNINNIVQNVIGTVKVAAKDKGIELKTNIETFDDSEQLLIDKVAFSQILINLAYNAIRYTKEGHVCINVKEKKRTSDTLRLRFEIKDTGIGIKEEHRSVVFNAFENRTFLEKNSSGSGLGLYIVKTLLKSHNSDIDFTSQPNVGTTFFFEIDFDIAPTAEDNIKTLSAYKKEMHVLVVDDNKVNLLITKKNLEKIEGYHAEIVTNGREAISMIKNKAYDLILMDINMPDMDGYEASKHIRMFNPKIPILALTALNSSEILMKAQEAGINQIITKPYNFEDFKAIVLNHSNASDLYFNCIAFETM